MAFGHLEGPLGPMDTCKKKNKNKTFGPPFFFIGTPPIPHPADAHLPLAQSKKKMVAILDFTDVKNVTEQNGGKGRGPGLVFYMD